MRRMIRRGGVCNVRGRAIGEVQGKASLLKRLMVTGGGHCDHVNEPQKRVSNVVIVRPPYVNTGRAGRNIIVRPKEEV
jgi:hypothetical protein